MRHRRHPVRPVSRIAAEEDPFRAPEQTYARNLFVSTVLRRLERSTLYMLEDAAIAQEWASESTCKRCGGEDLDGDHIRQHLKRWLATHGIACRVAPPASPVKENLKFIAESLDLPPDEVGVLQFLITLGRSERLQEVANSLGNLALPDGLKIIGAATRLSYARATAALAHGTRLVQTGIVIINEEPSPLFTRFFVRNVILDLISLPSLDRETFLHAFLDPSARATLTRADFHDTEAIGTACALVGAAARNHTRGVNLLLYGPTGVGKTELARLLGEECGLEVLAVGRADADGASATPQERLSSLQLALQLAPPGRFFLLFDEVEDLFRWELDLFTASRAAPQMSKQWFGTLLEENAIPIVWCTNRIEGIDPAFLRRFAYAVELKSPGSLQRARILASHLGKESRLGPEEIDAVAQRFDVSPAQLATAVRGARLVAPDGAPDRDTIERLLAPVHKAITGSDARLRPIFEPRNYRLDALHCRADLPALAERIAHFQPGAGPGVSLCLYGHPGTGKSELVKYLAWRSSRPLTYRRVSDLVSPWVGRTEQKIAASFEEARQDGSVLLFDEADSFLRDRRGALHSWEATQVNEFLQQLEAFPGICACTTNLFDDLDQAALRRFVFKLELLFLRPEQATALFALSFPWAAMPPGAEHELRQLSRLAPGDFAAVSRRIRALGVKPDASSLVHMLADEVSPKSPGGRPIGF